MNVIYSAKIELLLPYQVVDFTEKYRFSNIVRLSYPLVAVEFFFYTKLTFIEMALECYQELHTKFRENLHKNNIEMH